ncbi:MULTISPECIES: FAD-dependent monooxygenase [Streptosporangium]|uniref:2-polyprenyl-6-methoxyphenol hydroxylase-like FAD-dependent oxidoreductase n=1 Tax=Streptosporangium brasiliense TaxID=47480 RepID=A0ABT9QYH5_9ACTN|nr:FAD-dependent monooxygenase [Streptosporangium brasiliense]MDP9861245.1 2-polyprenyl-6-methoxyphenol hydroxylase-like FAD-dependent oxidoreductase [Streptosporangium brasiliense]
MSYDVDVVVAGGGPVGLMLACELRLGGVSVVVLERLAEMDPTIKAGALNTPSVEALYRRGLLPALQRAQEENLERYAAFMRQRLPEGGPAKAPPRFAGHFAGIMLSGDRLDPSDPELTGHGPADLVGMVNQQQLEELLALRAAELGVEVRRGVELTGLEADADGVTVMTGDGRIRGRWLAGCDGGRSTVRKLAGFDFPGTGPEITAYQAMVEMEGSQALGAGWQATPTGVYAHGPMPGRVLTVEFGGAPADRDAPVTADELQASIRNVSGVDAVVTGVRTATRFTDNARQATTYRLGRVLLAGDAAHVHSPFGGQGLNLGLGDAMNLGWKLAATVRGRAPEGLLDTYTAERHPIGAWVLDWTRAQIALMRPDPHARALREVVAQLAETVTGTTYFVKKISGVWQRYDLPGDHRLIGGSAPDLGLADGSRLADHLHDGRALLLDPAGELRAAAGGYGDRLKVVTGALPDRPELAGLLVRPDGAVAWAADAGRADPGALEAALRAWLGAPAS